MMVKTTIAVALITVFQLTASAQEFLVTTKQLQQFSSEYKPGIQYVVVDKDSIIFEQSVGLADIKTKTRLELGHTMAAFSMTKTLTAIAVLQLVGNNSIKLDDALSAYVEHPYSADITIRQLLSHTSGIPNPIPLRWVHLIEKHEGFDEQKAMIQVLAEHSKQDNKAGEKYAYSNIGYWLLGRLIANVSKQSYAEYITKHVFKPLRLNPNEIGFLVANNQNHVKGYLKKWSFMNIFGRFFIDAEVLGEYEGDWLHIHNVYMNGAAYGGAIGSASAFAKILQDLLADQSKLLGSKTKKLLYVQQTTKTGEPIDMTLGWHIDSLKGETYYYKEGGGAGFHSEMRMYPKSGIASVIMTNKTSFDSRNILSDLDIMYIKQTL